MYVVLYESAQQSNEAGDDAAERQKNRRERERGSKAAATGVRGREQRKSTMNDNMTDTNRLEKAFQCLYLINYHASERPGPCRVRQANRARHRPRAASQGKTGKKNEEEKRIP